MAGNVELIQELCDIALERGFEPPTYKIVKKYKSYRCVMKFYAYTVEASAITEDQSLNVCSNNMLIFWKSPDEFKPVCSKELNITIHYEELYKTAEDEKRKKSELNNKNFHDRTLYPVSYIYEYAARTKNKNPEFIEVAFPNKQFGFICHFMGKTSESECMPSKRTARHDAALKMIELIGLDIPSEVKLASPKVAKNEEKTNYIGLLQELAIKINEAPPIFKYIGKSGPQHCHEFKVHCSCMGKSSIGYGKTKKEARSAAAAQVLPELRKQINEI